MQGMRYGAKWLGWWIMPLAAVASLAAAGSDTRLVQAVKNKDLQTALSLLQQHIDVNTPAGDGSTALSWAAHWDDLQTAERLIRAGANVNAANDFGVTPLWEACNNGSAAMAAKLADAGANPNIPLLRSGETALMRCARTGSAEAVKALLDHGADANAKENQKGQTALMWALEERHPDVARLLIDHGADVHARSKGGFTPLLFAARQGDIESARLLLDRGANVNETTPGGLSVLLMAIDCGRESFAILLLDKGANPNAADPDGLTPLHYSLRKGISILRAAINTAEFPGLDYVFRPNMPALVNALLEHGANPNARIRADLPRFRVNDLPQLGLSGATPFLLAAATADLGVMRALLAKGADPNIATNDGVTPLMVAAGVGRREDRSKEEEKQALEVIKALVELGADVNAASHAVPPVYPNHPVSHNEGLTALHGAAFTGADEIVQFLVDKGAKLDAMDRFGETPLSFAEGDPNGLMADYGEPMNIHRSTADLLRKLADRTMASTSGVASADSKR
jgi:uncharacterized protein